MKANNNANNVQMSTQFAHATPKQTWPTGSCIPKAKRNFRLQFFKIKKLNNQNFFDQSDSCGFSAQLRVCVKTLLRIIRNQK